MADPVAEFKQGARATWAAGEWDEVSTLIEPVGRALIEKVGIEQGMDVLDVGTGSGGTVAIPAAERGANVIGSDLTPELFEDARRRASEAGVEVEWVEADAEALPFDDGSFDRVLSTFGHMFAPRHAEAARELARVCKPGGVVGTSTWTPEGANGHMFKTVGKHMPPPPDFVESPVLWGSEEHVREMLEPHGIELEFDRMLVPIEYESAEEMLSWWEARFGPMVMARKALGERWPDLRNDMLELYEEWNVADDGRMRYEPECLLTVGRKRG